MYVCAVPSVGVLCSAEQVVVDVVVDYVVVVVVVRRVHWLDQCSRACHISGIYSVCDIHLTVSCFLLITCVA